MEDTTQITSDLAFPSVGNGNVNNSTDGPHPPAPSAPDSRELGRERPPERTTATARGRSERVGVFTVAGKGG